MVSQPQKFRKRNQNESLEERERRLKRREKYKETKESESTRGLGWAIGTPLFRRLCLFLYACVFVLILVETSEIKTTSQVSQENRAQTDAGPPRVLCDSPVIRTS